MELVSHHTKFEFYQFWDLDLWKEHEAKFLIIELNLIIFDSELFEAGQQSSFYSSVTLFSFLSFQFLKMMYTRFTFGEYKKKLDKNKHPHPYGVFEGPLGSSPKDEFGWMSKLRIQQTRLSSKLTDDSLHNTLMPDVRRGYM